MARLTTFSRLLITVAIVAGIFFGVKYVLKQTGLSPEGQAAQSTETPDESRVTGTENGATLTFTVPEFNYSPVTPVNGKLKGIVELGATGFNSFIISVDAKKNWKLEKPEYGVSLVKEGLATDEDVKTGLRRYIADMVAFGVGARDIHFIVSSGARKEPIMPKIESALKAMGYVVNVVTPEQEGQYGLKAALPASFYQSGFMVDIGSGNTKISWYPSGAIELPGAKYYQNNISAEQVAQEVKSKAAQVPQNLRNTCFIIGGVPYELAKQTRKDKERYTLLKAPGDYKAEGAKQQAGLNIYTAIAESTGCKQFVFDWDANFAIGFLLNL